MNAPILLRRAMAKSRHRRYGERPIGIDLSVICRLEADICLTKSPVLPSLPPIAGAAARDGTSAGGAWSAPSGSAQSKASASRSLGERCIEANAGGGVSLPPASTNPSEERAACHVSGHSYRSIG
jgi:hypothetical protein